MMELLADCRAYESESMAKNSHLFTKMAMFQNDDLFLLFQPTSTNLPGSFLSSKNKNPNHLFIPSIYRYSLRNMYYGMSALVDIIQLSILSQCSSHQYEDDTTYKFRKGTAGELFTEDQNPMLTTATFKSRLKYLSKNNPIITHLSLNQWGDMLILSLDGRCIYLNRQSNGKYLEKSFVSINQYINGQKILACCFLNSNYHYKNIRGTLIIATINTIIILHHQKSKSLLNNNQHISSILSSNNHLILNYQSSIKIINYKLQHQNVIQLNASIIKINHNNQLLLYPSNQLLQPQIYPKNIDQLFAYFKDNKFYISSYNNIFTIQLSLLECKITNYHQIDKSQSIIFINQYGNYITTNHKINNQINNPEIIKLICTTNNGLILSLTTHYDKNYKEGRIIMFIPSGKQILLKCIQNVKRVSKIQYQQRDRSRDKISKIQKQQIQSNIQWVNFKDIMFLRNKAAKQQILDQLIPIYKKYYKDNKNIHKIQKKYSKNKNQFNQNQNTIIIYQDNLRASQFQTLCLNIFHHLEWKQVIKHKIVQNKIKDYFYKSKYELQIQSLYKNGGFNKCIISGKQINQEDVFACLCCGVYAINQGQPQVCYICYGKMQNID